ncbi:MAG: branched-chain amino acid ABC transporter permease [Candidatus Hodarchaeales archaeon]
MKNQSKTDPFTSSFLQEEKKVIVGLIIFFVSCLIILFYNNDISTALQLITNSLILGTLYSVLALGFSLVLGIAKQFKLSLGGYYVVAAYTMFFLLKTVKLDPALSTDSDIDKFFLLILILLPVILVLIILRFLRTVLEKKEFVLILISPIISGGSFIFLETYINKSTNFVEGFYVGLTVITVGLIAWFLEFPKRKVAIGTFLLGIVIPLLVLISQLTQSMIGQEIPVVYLALMTLAVTFTGCLAMLSDRYIIEKVRKSVVNVLIVTFALALILQSVVQIVHYPETNKFILFGVEIRSLPSLIPLGNFTTIRFTEEISIRLQDLQVISMLFCIFAVFLLYIFIWHTKIGRALRAVSQDDEAAALAGIDIQKSTAIVSGIGMALIGFAAVLTSPYAARPYWGPYMGWSVLIMAIAIVTLGGMGSLPGSVIAAFIFSFTEVIVSSDPTISNLSALIPFVIVLLVMILKPEGLLGIEEETE